MQGEAAKERLKEQKSSTDQLYQEPRMGSASVWERLRERDWPHAGIAAAGAAATGPGLGCSTGFSPQVSAQQLFIE